MTTQLVQARIPKTGTIIFHVAKRIPTQASIGPGKDQEGDEHPPLAPETALARSILKRKRTEHRQRRHSTEAERIPTQASTRPSKDLHI